MYDEDLARMRAQMLAKQEEEPPIFDDGARFLGQDPNMMQVGLFGRPKKPTAPPAAPPVNLQRRSILGLTPMPADLPAVIPPSAQPKLTPQQMEQAVKPQATFPGPHPEVWSSGPFMSMGDLGDVIKRHLEERKPWVPPSEREATPPAIPTEPSASPLQSLANKTLNAPISRREVLKKTGQAALQQVLPTPSISDIAPQVISPVAAIAQNKFVPNPGIDTYIQDYVSNGFSEGNAIEPFAATTSMYESMRDYLNGRVPQKELDKFDKLKDRVDRYYDSDNVNSDRAISAQETLADFLFEKMKLLKPHELLDLGDNFNEETMSFMTPEDFYNNILESRGGQGLEILGVEGFTKYLEASEKSPKPVIPEAPKPAPKPKAKPKGK